MTAVDRAVDLNELERLARAATPGPWFYQPSEHPEPLGIVYGPDGDSFVTVAWNPGNDYDQLATAEYLAALWPDVVLALVERVRRLTDALEICADDEGPPDAALDAIGINRRNIARHALRADPHDLADDEAAARWTAARIDGGVGQ